MNSVRTSSTDQDFIALVKLLDQELAIVDGDDHAFYHQFNSIDVLKHTIVLYENNIPVGCGAIKKFDDTSAEVKRMYTLTETRGKGVATKVLLELEKWAKELNYKYTILETGKRLPDAIALYQKNGYEIIPNYGQYVGIENSVCFRKELE
ncbi:GNAT family N-acetyltransferase [Flavobacteriaceae sp. LMIT009]